MDVDTIKARVYAAWRKVMLLPVLDSLCEQERQNISNLLKDAMYNGLDPFIEDGRKETVRRLKVWIRNDNYKNP